MPMSDPRTGDIWRYPYLWSWQAERGETEGRKPRPVTLAAVVPIPGVQTTLYLLPITSLPPDKDRDALEIPATEVRRTGLTDAHPLWIIFDEHNRDILERSYHFEHDGRIGAFSKAFLAQVTARFRDAYLRRGGAAGVDRTKQ